MSQSPPCDCQGRGWKTKKNVIRNPPCDEIRGISDGVGSYTDVTLFDESDSLGAAECMKDDWTRLTHRADGFRHLRHTHENGQSSSTERGNCESVVDVADLGHRVQHSHVVQLRQQLPLHAGSERVLCWEQREPVGECAQGPTELVVPGARSARNDERRVAYLW
jgi:hypothetical protein